MPNRYVIDSVEDFFNSHGPRIVAHFTAGIQPEMPTNLRQAELKEIMDTDIREAIPAEKINRVLSSDPFIAVPGILNIRDLGVSASPYVRRGLIYRSGSLTSLPEESKDLLANGLGIKLIVDLRSGQECSAVPDPEIDGVKYLSIPAQSPLPIELADFVEDGGKNGFRKIYEEILESHGPSIKAVLEHGRDGGGPVLFHCTAGKDRTGVLAAVILGLAGTPADVIAYDYSLSRIGIEPRREALLGILLRCRQDWSLDTPGLKEFSETKPEFMLAFLDIVKEKYGGMEGYVKKSLGFSEEEIGKIRLVLKRE